MSKRYPITFPILKSLRARKCPGWARDHVILKGKYSHVAYPRLPQTLAPRRVFAEQLFNERVRCAKHCEDAVAAGM